MLGIHLLFEIDIYIEKRPPVFIWLILILIGLPLLFLLICFFSGLLTLIPLPIKKQKLADEIKYIIALSEGLHPEVTYSDSADLAFDQRIWNPELEKIRQACLEVGRLHRSRNQIYYCDSIGVLKLKEILQQLNEIRE